MEWQDREWQLQLVFREAAAEAEPLWKPLAAWLFKEPGPKHEELMARLDAFVQEITCAPVPETKRGEHAGERLLSILETLENITSTKEQIAVLYYAIGLGLLLATPDTDGGTAGRMPAGLKNPRHPVPLQIAIIGAEPESYEA